MHEFDLTLRRPSAAAIRALALSPNFLNL